MGENVQEELSQEQTECLVTYQVVTGIEDIASSKENLIEHNWDVESAVQEYLSRNELSTTQPDLIHEQNESVQVNTENRIVQVTQTLLLSPIRIFKTVFNWFFSLASFPFRVIFQIIYRQFLPYSRPTDALEDVIQFLNEFEKKYGAYHPSFYQGSYSQALSHAKSQLKFLIVYLHCHQHQQSDDFCSKVLCDPRIAEYINSNVIFWAASVSTAEGYRVSYALKENGYPFLAVIVLKGNRMTVVGRFEGFLGVEYLLNRLKSVIAENDAHLVVARADREELQVNAALRLQQDEAYQESLSADREKARKKQEVKDLEKSLIDEREKIRTLKVEWVDRIPEEPQESEKDVIQVVAKLPQGARLERRFYTDSSLTSLYYYIFCHPDSPDRFQVTTNFPRRVVPCEPMADGSPVSTTFSDFGLPQRSMLFVSDLDA